MPATLTKVAIRFDEFRIRRETTFDLKALQEVTRWYVSVRYEVTTQEGEVWNRDLTEEVTGTFKTKAENLLTTVRDRVLQKEGL